jgi:uncharacterized protein (TIGR02001 family)
LKSAARIFGFAAIAAATLPASAPAEDFVVNFSTDLLSDSIERGITQSAHRPAVSSTIELQKDWFYVSTEISTVKPPTSPVAEVGLGVGIRPTIPGFEKTLDIDINVVRYQYPGATPIDASGSGAFTEAEASAIYHFPRGFHLGAEVAYSPNYNNSGAHSVHAAVHAKLDLPQIRWLPVDSSYLWGKVGRMQFGTVSEALGGFQLPNYTHWLLGVGFKKDPFTLELNYTNTTLSREDCFIQTGDPSAAPGGIVSDPNPLGQRSTWCGPAFFAKLTFDFSSDQSK